MSKIVIATARRQLRRWLRSFSKQDSWDAFFFIRRVGFALAHLWCIAT